MERKNFVEKTLLSAVGIFLIGFGVITTFSYLVLHHLSFLSTNATEALSIFLYGVALLFLPRKTVIPFGCASLALGLGLMRLYDFHTFQVDQEFGTQGYVYQYCAPLTLYLWLSAWVHLGSSLFLLCTFFARRKVALYWIAGILGASVLGAGGVVVNAYIVDIPYKAFWGEALTLSFFDVSALTLFILTGLFYLGLRLHRNNARHYMVWIAVVVGMGCFGAVISSWAAFRQREHSLILANLNNEFQIVEKNGNKEVVEYFKVLDRLEKRWESYPKTAENRAVMVADTHRYFSSYPFLMQVRVVKDGEAILDETRADFSPLSKPITPINTSSFSVRIFNALYEGQIIEDGDALYLVSYVKEKKASGAETLYIVNDLKALVGSTISPIFLKNNALEIFFARHSLISSESDTRFRKKYGALLTWDFFGLPFEVWIWPKSTMAYALQPLIGFYHLLIGLVFSAAFAACIYLIQLSNKKKQEAEKLNLEKTFFLGNISHELRTPLQAVIGALSLFETTGLNEEQKKWLLLFSESSHKLHTLINELIELSKIDLKGVEVNNQPGNLKALVLALHEQYAQSVAQKDLIFECAYQSDLPNKFFFDASRLRQTLVQLISNALKYTEKGSISLVVSGKQMSPDQVEVKISVRDTGRGIPTKEREILFEKYKHIDIRSSEGSGIGLAIVAQLVDTMEGKIVVESVEGGGSEFALYLTLQTVPEDVISLEEDG